MAGKLCADDDHSHCGHLGVDQREHTSGGVRPWRLSPGHFPTVASVESPFVALVSRRSIS